MAKRRGWSVVAALASAVAALVASAPTAAKADNHVALAVIVARSSKLTNIALSELRQAFRSERPSERERLIALNHPPRTVDRVGFDRVVLGMDPEAVGRFWIGRKVQGAASPPRSVSTLATLRRVVEKLPGAIGYIRPSQLSSEVRAIRVDGKMPEDRGYPVRYQP